MMCSIESQREAAWIKGKNTINYQQESEGDLFDIREKHGKGDDKLGSWEFKLASNFLSSVRNKCKQSAQEN